MAHIIEISNPFEPLKDTKRHEHAGGITIRAWLEETYPGFINFSKPTYCLVNGEPILRKSDIEPCWENYIIKPNDVVNFVVVPGDPVTLLYVLYAVLVVATIAIALSLPKPTVPGENSPDTVYDLKGQRNQNRLSNPIEDPYGRCRLYPSYAAKPYNLYVGNEQYQFSLYCLGNGYFDIEAIQFEDTLIGNFEDVTYEIYEPGEPATMFPDNVVTSTEVGGIELLGTNEPGFQIFGGFAANDSGTQTDLLQVDVVLPLGLYYGRDDGSLDFFTVRALFEYREIDDAGAPVGAGTWLTFQDWSVTLKTSTPQRFTLEKSVPPGRYEVRAQRIGDHDERARITNVIRWDALRAFLPSVQNYPEVTLIAVKARATNGLNDNTSQRLNIWATRKLPIYDPETETWSALTATRNPVWAFCNVFRAKYGGQLADQFLALDELAAFAATFATEGRNFDFVFDTKSTVWDAATTIARVVRARPIMNGSQVTMVRDVPKSVVTAVFSPFNMVKGSFKWDIKMAQVGDFDGVQIEYIDSVTWKPETIDCLVDDDIGDNLEVIKLAGCTDRQAAYEEGMYLRRCRRQLRENVSFETELEGHIPSYGDLIKVSHDLPRWGLSGLVRSIVGTTVVLSEPVDFTGGSKVIGFRKKDGSESGPHACTAGSNAYTVILGAPLSDSFYFDGIHELPMFLFGAAGMAGKQCSVVNLTPEEGKVTVKAVVYDGTVFTGGTAPAPSNNGVPNTPTLPTLNCSSLVAGWDPVDVTKARLAWAPATAAIGYRVETSPDGDNWSVVTNNTPDTSVVVSPEIGEDLYFRVQPIGNGGVVGTYCVKLLESFAPPPGVINDPNNDYSGEMPLYTPPSASYAYRAHGVTAFLRGFPTYTPTTPPDLYLQINETSHRYATCNGGVVVDANGLKTESIDPNTGAYSSSGFLTGFCTMTNPAIATPTELYLSTEFTGTGWGCTCGGGYGWPFTESAWERYVLTNKDTEEAAISRAESALTPLTSLGWTNCMGIFPCAISLYEERTTLTYFGFQKAHFQVTLSGMTPGDNIIGFFPIFKRPHGSSSWVQDSVMEFDFTADGSGNYSMWFEVPFEKGFDFGCGEAFYRKVTVLEL